MKTLASSIIAVLRFVIVSCVALPMIGLFLLGAFSVSDRQSPA